MSRRALLRVGVIVHRRPASRFLFSSLAPHSSFMTTDSTVVAFFLFLFLSLLLLLFVASLLCNDGSKQYAQPFKKRQEPLQSCKFVRSFVRSLVVERILHLNTPRRKHSHNLFFLSQIHSHLPNKEELNYHSVLLIPQQLHQQQPIIIIIIMRIFPAQPQHTENCYNSCI
jgi:hypothetical protein